MTTLEARKGTAVKTKHMPDFRKYVLNCTKSSGTETDWGFDDALESQSFISGHLKPKNMKVPKELDLRERWWKIRDQCESGACVGFATADGVLRWHYVKKNLIKKTDLPSPRFIWMANKETDNLTRYPTTFLEPAGTTTKLALGIAQKFGCVLELMLPMDGQLSPLSPSIFYAIAAQYRINSYYNLGVDLAYWRKWIANYGPILTRLDVDDSWKNATATKGKLEMYNNPTMPYGGHAVCLVGYDGERFIVRNSWGPNWGDRGFAYASDEYAEKAFTDAYGVIV